jgi:hypothetical protein
MRRPDSCKHPPHSFEPTLASAYFLAFAALLCGGHTPRVRPGGPFISLIGDVLPVFMALVAIGFAFYIMWSHRLFIRLNAWFTILIALIAIGMVYVDIYRFWIRPYARGELLGL